MVGKTRKASAAQKDRMANIKLLGCLCCLLEGVTDRHATVHHIVEGNRLGHDFTIGLCGWHHQAECPPNISMIDQTSTWGPSLKNGSKLFNERYGSERKLLRLQDFILRAFDSDPWEDYIMPQFMVSQAREFWKMDQTS